MATTTKGKKSKGKGKKSAPAKAKGKSTAAAKKGGAKRKPAKLHPVEQSIIDATAAKARGKGEGDQEYRERLMQASYELGEEQFESLPIEAQAWTNAAIESFNNGSEIADFDEVVVPDPEAVDDDADSGEDEAAAEDDADGDEDEEEDEDEDEEDEDEDEDEEDEDEDEDEEDEDEDEDEDEQDVAPVKKPKKKKAKESVSKKDRPSYQFRKLVCQKANRKRKFKDLFDEFSSDGEIAKTSAYVIYSNVQDTLEVLRDLGVKI